MTPIDCLVPPGKLDAGTLAGRLDDIRRMDRYAPFDTEAMKLAGALSQRLLDDREARGFPELQALGFWLRPAALEAMKKDFIVRPGTVAVPQGLVFHIPPANIDTMFVYSLFISLLCGNANIARLPSDRGPAMMLLVRLLGDVLAQAPDPLRNSQLRLGYAHDDVITGTMSMACDLRVIWGGDASVSAMRALALQPSGRELIFPDRFSWSALDLEAYRALDDAARQQLAERFCNDLFWFDQQGCASPRILLWRGKTDCPLRGEFYRRVAQVATDRDYRLDTGASLAKRTRNYGAIIDAPVTEKRDFGALTVLTLADLSVLENLRQTPGFGGSLLEFSIKALTDVAAHIERRDQTLTQFGYTPDEIDAFVKKLNGKGIDRVVPVGDALAFHYIWDGYDLPAQFTRLVTVKT